MLQTKNSKRRGGRTRAKKQFKKKERKGWGKYYEKPGKTEEKPKLKSRRARMVAELTKDLEYNSLAWLPKNVLDVETIADQVVISPSVQGNFCSAISIAFVQLFIARGGQFTSETTDGAYMAYIYLAETLKMIAEGGTPKMSTAPYVFGFIAAHLSRKIPKQNSGKIAYSFDFKSDVDRNNRIPTGPGDASVINLGHKTTSRINGIIPTTAPPAAYTEELGVAAVNEIWDFLNQKDEDDRFVMHPFPLPELAGSTNASAYAFTTNVVGGGQFGTGGIYKTVSNEVGILTPFMAACIPYAPGPDIGRALVKSVTYSGDATSAAGSMCLLYNKDQYNSRRAQNFKAIDFDLLTSIMARYFGVMQQYALDDPDYTQNLVRDPDFYANELQYPLTLQNFRLLLRNLVMQMNADDQLVSSTVYPTEEIGSSIVFRPFVCGYGQGPYGPITPMNLPKSCTEKIINMLGKQMVPHAWRNNPLTFIPTWGVYTNHTLKTDDYQVKFIEDGDVRMLNTFPTDVTETVIDIVDGTAGKECLVINDPAFIQLLALEHNKWMERWADYTTRLAPPTIEPGINVFSTVGKTVYVTSRVERESDTDNYLIPGEEDMTSKEIAATKKKYAEKYGRKLSPAVDVYDDESMLVRTSRDKPIQTVRSGLALNALYPTTYFQTPVTNADNNIPQTGQAYTGEVFTEPLGEGNEFYPVVGNVCQQIAFSWCKPKYAAVKDVEIKYEQADAAGEGGGLGALVAAVSGGVVRAGGNFIADVLEGGI